MLLTVAMYGAIFFTIKYGVNWGEPSRSTPGSTVTEMEMSFWRNKMTTYCTANYDNFVKMATFRFQCTAAFNLTRLCFSPPLHYSNVKWPPMHLNWPASRHRQFVQQFVQADIKGNAKALHHWPGNPPVIGGFPPKIARSAFPFHDAIMRLQKQGEVIYRCITLNIVMYIICMAHTHKTFIDMHGPPLLTLKAF